MSGETFLLSFYVLAYVKLKVFSINFSYFYFPFPYFTHHLTFRSTSSNKIFLTLLTHR